MKILTLSFLLFLLIPFDPAEIIPDDFVYLQDIIPDITVDLRYYSSDNFVGDTIDGYRAGKCIISRDAAKALSKVQRDLKSTGYSLKVFDAYRPQQAVDHFVRWANDLEDTLMKSKFYPEIDKSFLFEQGYISSKSGHTRGSTIDLTIIYNEGSNKGRELDMGTTWDFFSTKSWPSSNETTEKQKANRMLLKKVMTRHGFRQLMTEWWHFTLIDEPYPDTYFDFSIE
jgi:D-alanyl-D-alanine dipeptidase